MVAGIFEKPLASVSYSNLVCHLVSINLEKQTFHIMKLLTKYERPGPSSFGQKDLKKNNYIKTCSFHKKGQCQPKVIILSILLGPCLQCRIPSPQAHWPFGSGENDLYIFTIIDRGDYL